MIGRMRPFYQAHWDISKDIKHVWLLFCTYHIAWIFQWILGDEGRGKWWDRQYRVWIPQCAAPLDVTVTYARDSFVDSPAGPFVFSRGGPRYPGCYCYICKRQFLWIHRLGLLSSRGGAQISWHQSYTTTMPHSPFAFIKCSIWNFHTAHFSGMLSFNKQSILQSEFHNTVYITHNIHILCKKQIFSKDLGP